jgi:hypothetical protein
MNKEEKIADFADILELNDGINSLVDSNLY